MYSRQESDSDKPFELIPSEIRLVSDEEFATDVRLEALAKRFKNSHTFRDTQKWIGLTTTEIDSHFALDELKNDDISGLDFSMDAMRRAGLRYAAMIRYYQRFKKIMKQSYLGKTWLKHFRVIGG